ncbi:MAG TPA: Hsp70 family protein [Planctomycetota bacterium]
MDRTTIDFGIDLGTTNSEIAVFKGGDVEVIKNNANEEFTPSVVWIRDNRLIVGRNAKQQLFVDPDNVHAEFKLRMGTSEEFAFKRSGRRLRPEELSAEVLKSLRADVKQRLGEDVEAAVITVPADFDLPQNQATSKAAKLAGFQESPLLTEPAAAALAYGFKSKDDKVFWLVFDFGGGTFDAALVQLRDGQIDVVNHGGDNQLGGKLIDWAIVDQLLAPEVARRNALSDFRRGNPRWSAAFAKLKLNAEAAKIGLSREEATDIYVDPLCKDDRDQDVTFEFELKRRDVEKLIDPFAERAINICRKVLQEANLKPGAVEKLILVGGPTMTPYLRDRLSDRKSGLGIPMEFSVDPLTIVARGAAIFAGSQPLKREAAPRPAAAGTYGLELVYDRVTHDPEPPFTGKLSAAGNAGFAGFTVEIVNPGAKPVWRSGRISVPPNGAFIGSLWMQEGLQVNTFQIELKDAAGFAKEVEPKEIRVSWGNVIVVPLAHSVGVAMANGETDFFVAKNAELPAQRRQVHRTVRDIKKGAGAGLRIPVVEGQSPKADRNRLIGTIEIQAADIKRDLPAGSEVEITIKIDKSRLVTSKAYVPDLDQEFESVLQLERKEVPVDQLEKDIEFARGRLAALRAKAAESGDDPGFRKAQQAIGRVDGERMMSEVDEMYRNARISKEEADKCNQRLQHLNLALDEAEDALQWPQLKTKVDEFVTFMHKIVNEFGKPEEKARAAALERDCRAALGRDAAVVEQKLKEISRLTGVVWPRDPGYWVAWFQELSSLTVPLKDPALAERLFNRGRMAIDDGDLPGLKAVIEQLLPLLPKKVQEEQENRHGGGTQSTGS